MTIDSELEGRRYPCEAASVKKLDEMIQRISMRYEYIGTGLEKYICAESPMNIRWDRICHLRIVGGNKAVSLNRFLAAGIPRGFYLNADGRWLLVILSENTQMGELVSRCGVELESLWIQNARLHLWNLGKLPGLRELHLADNPALENMEQLLSLPKLERLHISNCSRLVTNPDLGKLVNLKKLTIIADDDVSTLPGLGNLTQLTELTLRGITQLTELTGIRNLTQLTKLELAACSRLTALPGLEKLTQLTKLSLYDCSGITALPGLEKLTQLTEMSLSECHGITTLPGLEKLTQLENLQLSSCGGITDLPGLENLANLTKLRLFSCDGIQELPDCLRHTKTLRSLELACLRLRDLPDWLPEIADCIVTGPQDNHNTNEATVYLRDTIVDEIKDMSIFERPYEMVVKWFEDRRLGRMQPLNEIKVVFLGDGEAGKSYTIARLMNGGGEPMGYTDGSTPGIVIKHRNYIVDGRKFKVHYWDFGGQEIMHSMHRIFLTGRTMYVILLNARDDTQGDRAQYWLHNIKSFAPGAPVLLVLNKIDQNQKASVDERTLCARYAGLKKVVRLSALRYTTDEFNKAFTDVLLDEIKNTGYLDAEWPGSWIQVKHELESMNAHYILGKDYTDICRKYQVNDVQAELLRWFNDLGVSFCFCEEEDYALKHHVILRPDWITNALYIILFNECAGADNGCIPHKAIYHLLGSASTDSTIRCTLPGASYDQPGDIEYVLGVMRRFQLSLGFGNGNEFIPMLCQQGSTVEISDYENDIDLLEFRMVFEYLPDNLLHRLMVERYAELDIANVWRTGARFRFAELGFSAMVVIDNDALRFFIRHTNPMHRPNTYLTMLKAHVDRIVEKMGLAAPSNQLIYKLDEKQDAFDYEVLKAMQEVGQTHAFSMVWRRMIPIEDIFNQSAPEGLEDVDKLLDAIRRSCGNIQGEPGYALKADGRGMEDKRNRRIRDDLFGWGYNIQDQTQRGRSGSGRGIGELDMLLYNDKRELWTAIEALRISNGAKTAWNDHLDKLLSNYNFFGARMLYLLTYVDTDPTAFAKVWKGYQSHIKTHNPGQFTYSDGSYVELNDTASGYVKIAKCQYTCGGDPITVYHIFAQISPWSK